MARKIQSGTGTFIKQTNKKRPRRHSKRPNKKTIEKNIEDKEEDDVLFLAYSNSNIVPSFFILFRI